MLINYFPSTYNPKEKLSKVSKKRKEQNEKAIKRINKLIQTLYNEPPYSIKTLR